MNEPLIGEIRSIAFNYAPKGWAFCNGQLLPITQNQALFSVLGVAFGGNGTTNFALPNLQGRVPVGIGQGAGLSNYSMGTLGGTESVTLNQTQLPTHTHPITGTLQVATAAEDKSPVDGLPATAPAAGAQNVYNPGPKNTTMGAPGGISGTTASQGGNAPHENRQPYLATNFVIALVGIYPSRD